MKIGLRPHRGLVVAPKKVSQETRNVYGIVRSRERERPSGNGQGSMTMPVSLNTSVGRLISETVVWR